MVQAPEVGWDSGQTWGILTVAAILLVGFVVGQAKGHDPLLRLGIFRAPNLAAANLAQLLLGAAWIPMWFFLNLYLQQVLGYTAFPRGAALVPMTLLIMIGMIGLAPRVLAAIGPKAATVTGLALLAAGMAWLALIDPDGSYAVDILPASLVAALDMSLAFIPTPGTAISAARPEEGGLASGIVNTSYQIGSALGLAVTTAVAAANGADQIGNKTALTDGFSAAFLGAAIVAGVGVLTTVALFRSPAAGTTEVGDTADKVAASQPLAARPAGQPSHPGSRHPQKGTVFHERHPLLHRPGHDLRQLRHQGQHRRQPGPRRHCHRHRAGQRHPEGHRPGR